MEKLDKKDKKILTVLENDARASVSEISRKTGLDRDLVHYRIQRLIKQKYIEFFHTSLDPIKLGFPIFSYVNFSLQNFDEEKEKRFYEKLVHNKNIIYVAKSSGKWDCIIAIAAKDLPHFDSIIKEVRREFSDIIKEFDVASIIKQYKYDSFVDLIE